MNTIKIWNDRPSDEQIDRICEVLERGELVILPTDTLYGIACDALNPKAIERLCRLKGLNPDKAPLSVICDGIAMAAEYGRIENDTFRMIRDNTPGQFTFLVRALSALPRAFKGRKTVGIRIPDNATARAVATRLGHPVMTTSIQWETEDDAREPELIAEAYVGRVEMMVDGGEGSTHPSTVVDCTGREMEIVRDGAGELK